MVRPARDDDAPRIFELMLALADYERLRHKFVGTADNLREHLFGSPRYAECLLAEEGGRIVGYALYYPTYSTFLTQPGLWMEDIFVLPEARGKGLGKALLAELCRLAQERGFARVDWAVLDWNEPSIRFYESIGASPMSEWTVYRLEGDALDRMTKLGSTTPSGGHAE